MSSHVEINGQNFITTREAAKVSNYSNDYISKLAREAKVKALQLGRQWYVDPISLNNFIANAVVEKKIRGENLKRERKLEREAKVAVKRSHDVAKKTAKHTSSVVVAAQALLILAAGTLAGSSFLLGHTMVSKYISANAENGMARSQSAQVSSKPIGEEEESSQEEIITVDDVEVRVEKKLYDPNNFFAQQTVAEPPADEVPPPLPPAEVMEKEVVNEDDNDSGVVEKGFLLLGEAVDESTEEYLRSLFSDEVNVEFSDEHTGTIAPVLRDGETGVGVRFIEVPVKQGND